MIPRRNVQSHKLSVHTSHRIHIKKCCEDMNRRLGIKFMLSEPIVSADLISKKRFEEFQMSKQTS